MGVPERARRGAPHLVLAGCALLAGCSLFVPRLQTPHLSVTGIDWLGGDLLTQRFRLHVHVQNPNDRALPVAGLSYTLYVFGDSLAQGVSATGFTVPAQGEAEFDTNVTANAAPTMLRLLTRADLRSRPVEYRLVGKVDLASGWPRSVPFEQRGTLSLK
jgi:LEA14-like dessication related protein